MKKLWKNTLSLTGAALLAAGSLIGCSAQASAPSEASSAAETAASQTSPESLGETGSSASATEDLSGSISMAGSTSMEKFVTALGEVFMEKYPGVTVTSEFVGSGAGVEAVSNGTADIGNSSRNLKDEEKAAGVAENIVAIDGIAVVTDASNAVEELTKEQLISIYKGEIVNWNGLGGADQPVVVIGRESGSGTRTAFEEILGLEDQCRYSNELDSTGAVMAKVASTPGAIGYVSLDVLDDTVKTLKLDGTEPSPETIQSGAYFLSRPFVMATKGEIDAQSEAVQALFDYIYSDEGTQLVTSVGLIPAN